MVIIIFFVIFEWSKVFIQISWTSSSNWVHLPSWNSFINRFLHYNTWKNFRRLILENKLLTFEYQTLWTCDWKLYVCKTFILYSGHHMKVLYGYNLVRVSIGKELCHNASSNSSPTLIKTYCKRIYQRLIQNSVKYCRWSFSQKVRKSLAIFAKKILVFLTGFWIHLWILDPNVF